MKKHDIRPAVFDPTQYPEDALQHLLNAPKDSSTIHYDEDTIPHGDCSDPFRCDCMCPECWRLKADIIRRAFAAAGTEQTAPAHDEECVPHPFKAQISNDVWCKDCAYHQDHAVHVAEQTAPADPPAEMRDLPQPEADGRNRVLSPTASSRSTSQHTNPQPVDAQAKSGGSDEPPTRGVGPRQTISAKIDQFYESARKLERLSKGEAADGRSSAPAPQDS